MLPTLDPMSCTTPGCGQRVVDRLRNPAVEPCVVTSCDGIDVRPFARGGPQAFHSPSRLFGFVVYLTHPQPRGRQAAVQKLSLVTGLSLHHTAYRKMRVNCAKTNGSLIPLIGCDNGELRTIAVWLQPMI